MYIYICAGCPSRNTTHQFLGRTLRVFSHSKFATRHARFAVIGAHLSFTNDLLYAICGATRFDYSFADGISVIFRLFVSNIYKRNGALIEPLYWHRRARASTQTEEKYFYSNRDAFYRDNCDVDASAKILVSLREDRLLCEKISFTEKSLLIYSTVTCLHIKESSFRSKSCILLDTMMCLTGE